MKDELKAHGLSLRLLGTDLGVRINESWLTDHVSYAAFRDILGLSNVFTANLPSSVLGYLTTSSSSAQDALVFDVAQGEQLLGFEVLEKKLTWSLDHFNPPGAGAAFKELDFVAGLLIGNLAGEALHERSSEQISIEIEKVEFDEIQNQIVLTIDQYLDFENYEYKVVLAPRNEKTKELFASLSNNFQDAFHQSESSFAVEFFSDGSGATHELTELSDIFENSNSGDLAESWLFSRDGAGKDAVIFTDLEDYAPGSTAYITIDGIEYGSSVVFEVDHVSYPGEDGEWGTFDDVTYQLGGGGHDPWYVTDGGSGDLDGKIDGSITTSWYVNPDDSLDERFLLSGQVVEAGADQEFGTLDDHYTPVVVYTTFTDSVDTDGDGILDTADLDDDNDGILDSVERTKTYDAISTVASVTFRQNIDGTTGGNAASSTPLPLIDGVLTTQAQIRSNVIVEYDLGQVLLPGTTIQLYEGSGGNDGLAKVFVSETSMAGPNAWTNTLNNSNQVYGGASGLASDSTVTITITEPTRYLQIQSIGGNAGWEELRFTTLSQTLDIDTDGDGYFDHRDVDSDNDGITDNVEAQSTAGYRAPSGLDTNSNGVDDIYGAGGISPVDTDGDGIADFKDADADGDGSADITERGDGAPTSLTSTTDTDADGLLDIFEGVDANDGFDANDENIVGDVSTNGSYSRFDLADTDADTNANEVSLAPRTTNDAVAGSLDLDFRDAVGDVDTDGDGIVDARDVDDDNDGILDIDEQTVTFQSLYDTATLVYTQNWDGDTATHYTTPGAGGGDDALNLLDNDLSTELRMHDGDIFEYDLGQVLPAGTIVVLVEGTGGEDTPIAIYRSLESTDPNRDKLALLGTGSGTGYDEAITNGTSTLVEAYLWDDVAGDFIRDVNGDPILYTYKDGSGGNFGGSAWPQVPDNVSKDGYTPSDATVAFVLQEDTRYIQFLGTPDGEKHGGWAEIQLASETQVIENLDTDNDGIPDHLDIDKDNDGITDNVEAQATGTYIAPSGDPSSMIDDNGDGLDDNYGAGLVEVDTDGDGTRDSRDADADGDGVADIVERGDGAPTSVTSTTDTDGDGLLDIFEGIDASDGLDVNDENIVGDDGGSDGAYDSVNLADTDEDTNANETVADRTTNDAAALTTDLDYRDAVPNTDTDGDGVIDTDDIDDDNDGILDVVEKSFTYQALSSTASVSYIQTATGAATTNSTAINLIDGNNATELDVDDATIIEYDLGQTLYAGTEIQFVEGTGTKDDYVEIWVSNGSTAGAPSGYANTTTLLYAGPSDATLTFTLAEDITHVQIFGRGGDTGFADLRLTSLTQVLPDGIDSDGDGFADHLDIDKDNDGITDNVEAQTTSGYIAPSGVGNAMIDVNNDGLDDNYVGVGIGPLGLTEVDTDGDGTVDTLDNDSDGDGAADIEERGDGAPNSITSTADTDQDGLLDIFEGDIVDDDFDVNDQNVEGDNGGIDGGYENFTLADSDGDSNATSTGTERTSNNAEPLTFDLDYRDVQADIDTDDDGIVDARDIDDDNDGILDTVEREFTYDTISSSASFSFAQFQDGSLNGDADRVYDAIGGGGVEDPSRLIDGNTGTNFQINKDFVIVEYDLGQVLYPGTTITLIESPTSGNDDGLAKVFVSSESMYIAPADAGTSWQNTLDNATQVYGGASGEASDKTVTITITEEMGPTRYVQILSYEDKVDWDDLQFTTTTQQVDVDTDGDGAPDYLDIDKDNDGISDNIEAQTTTGYVAPSGAGDQMVDANEDGLDDNYDDGSASGLTEVDTDSDGTPDTLDLDSDDDGTSDQVESGLSVAATADDADGDGLLDAYEHGSTADGFVVNDGVEPLDGTLPDIDNDAAGGVPLSEDLDFRDAVTTPFVEISGISTDTGFSSTDGITSDQTLVFSGTSIPGASVEVFLDGSSLGTVTVDSLGNWSLDYTGVTLADGDYALVATTTDVGSGVTVADSFDFTVDTTIAASITLDPVTSDNVINAAEAATDVAVTGTVGDDVQSGDTVTLAVGGNVYTGLVDASGGFSIDVPGSVLLADVDLTVAASVATIDAAGNSATATTNQAYTVDTDVAASITLAP
ncbi:Ig-like domain-containing protein, partial [Rhodobacterales bacterium HKCCSP123]|nr:Ig-like domain-containing protein [Rhodobacterales bacterium HKCCSP123]